MPGGVSRWEQPWNCRYHERYEADRISLGLGGPNFDYFFEPVEREALQYPWEFSIEVPESGGTRMRATREAFLDIPPLYVFYKVDATACRIVFAYLCRLGRRGVRMKPVQP